MDPAQFSEQKSVGYGLGYDFRLVSSIDSRWGMTAYAPRPGYALTVQKLRGAELEHVTFWPDVAGARGAAYTAVSSVGRTN